jgi:TolA-binding protein
MRFEKPTVCSGILLLILSFFSCRPSQMQKKNPELERIDSLESAMKKTEAAAAQEPDLNLAMHLAKAYQDYEAGHPDDTLSPGFLFRAGQVIENVFDDKARALELYYSVYRKYPKSSFAPYALFMTGNLHHSIRDSVNTVNMLNLFLAKYPGHPLKADAAAMISSFGALPDTAASSAVIP